MTNIHLQVVFLIVLCCSSLLGCKNSKSAQAQVEEPTIHAVVGKKQSIAQKLGEYNHLPVEERVALYRRLKKEDPKGYNFENEDEMTMYGYRFLWDGKVKEAIEIFKLIVEQFPNSSNPYDSLGEGYLADGDKEKSLINYQKSLELDPNNFNAEDQIERIKYPNKKQETIEEKFAKLYTSQAYKEDLDQLGKRLIEVHPNALKFISEKEFWQIIEEKKAMITPLTTYSEFRWHCSEIVASVNCSHTSTGNFYHENRMLPMSARFPLQTRWINEQLFVIDPLNNGNKVAIKDEIVLINGMAVSQLIKDIYKHIPSQGYVETTKRHEFNKWSMEMIPFALNFPKSYEIQVKGKEKSIVLTQTKIVKDPINDPSIEKCEDNLCFEIIENGEIAVLTISSFNYYPWNNLSVFTDFIDSSFEEINEKGIENLIVDLRFNGGGSPESSIHLLQYLVDTPFVYYSRAEFEGKTEKLEAEEVIKPFENGFQGKRYFLIDGNGNSTTGHFMSMVKVLNLGTIVGEELGSNQFCSAGQTICRLTHTKLEYYVANNTHESTATSLPDETGILPDHYVTQTIDEYLNKVDAVKEYALELIRK